MAISNGFEITGIAFVAAKQADNATGLVGWLTFVINGILVVDGVTVRRTREGRFVLSYPERIDRSGRRHPYIRPLDEATRKQLERQIFKALQNEEVRP